MSFLSSAVTTFFDRLGSRSRFQRRGPVLILFLLALVVMGVYGRCEAQVSACTHVLTGEQIEKLTGLPVERRSASHDEESCTGIYDAKRREILTIQIRRSGGEGSFSRRVEEARKSYAVDEVEDLDDPAVFLRKKSDGELVGLWVDRPAASGRIEVSFRGGAFPKEIDEGRLVKAVKPSFAAVDAYLRDLAPKPGH